METVLALSVDIGHHSYRPEMAEGIKDSLSELGPVQVRGAWSPAADNISDIVVVVQWIGLALAAGFVGEAGADFYRLLKRKLVAYYRDLAANFEQHPSLGEVHFAYDDVLVVVQLPGDERVPDFDEILELVSLRMNSGRLADLTLTRLDMPMHYEDEYGSWSIEWYPNSLEEYNIWAVTGDDAMWVQHPYDAANDEWLSESL